MKNELSSMTAQLEESSTKTAHLEEQIESMHSSSNNDPNEVMCMRVTIDQQMKLIHMLQVRCIFNIFYPFSGFYTTHAIAG